MRAPRYLVRVAGSGTWLFVCCLLLCCLVRAIPVVLSNPHQVFTRWSNVGDATLYDRFGWNIASQGVMGVGKRPSGFVMPGYPMFLAGVYRIFGHVPGAVRWVQVLVGAFAALMLASLARRLGGARAGLIALALAAVYPFFVYFVPEILTETLFLAAFGAMMVTSARVGSEGSVRSGILHGLSFAVALLTRSVALVMEPGVLLLARPWDRRRAPRRWAGLVFGGLIVAVAWGGWAVRNRMVFGEFVPLDTHGGMTLYTSQLISRGVPHKDVVEMMQRELGYYRYDIERGTLPGGPRAELEADRRASARAKQMIREDPAASLRHIPRNIAKLWLNEDFGEVGRLSGIAITGLIGTVAYYGVLIFALLGLWRLRSRTTREFFWCFVWILLSTTVLFAVNHGGKRYRVATIDPVLLVLAAWQLEHLVSKKLRRATPEVAVAR